MKNHADFKILIACEESQTVCKAFRERGFEAYSCDIIEPSGGHLEWHIKGDALAVIDGRCTFRTMDGAEHTITGKWDLLIAHPPCTYLTVAANKYYNESVYGEAAIARKRERERAADFFMRFINADCERIAVENPIGVMSTRYRKPDCIIQPYQFGHAERKATCLWLKGLCKLRETNVVPFEPIRFSSGKTDSPMHYKSFSMPKEERQRVRSRTFPGLAAAMAEQWGNALLVETE